jgi:hypothetical protein
VNSTTREKEKKGRKKADRKRKGVIKTVIIIIK